MADQQITALQRRLIKLELMVEHMQDVMIELDRQGCYRYLSPSYERCFGKTEGVLGTNCFHSIHPDDRERVMAVFQRGFNTMGDEQVTYRNHHPEKGYRWLEARGTTFYNDEGEPRALVTVRDITQRKQEEEALKRSEEKYRRIFEHAPLGIYHVNVAGYITHCNELFIRMIGSSREAIVGLNALNLKDQAYTRALRRALGGEDAFYEGDYVSETADKVTPLRVFFAPVKNSAGEVTDVIVIVEDATEKKLTEERLRRIEERWQFAVENSGDGVWDWNIMTGENQISDRWAQMLGYTPGDIRVDVEDFFNLLHAEDRDQVRSWLGDYARGEDSRYWNEFRMRCHDGSYKWILSIGKIVEWTATGKPLRAIGTHRDITRQKEAMEALKESERSKAVLLSNLPGVAYRCERREDGWHMVYVSQQCHELVGYHPEELIRKGASLKEMLVPEKLVVPAHQPVLWQKWQECLDQKETFCSEYQVHTRQGELLWAWEQGRLFENSLGEVTAIEGFITDITERKEAEEKNRQLDRLKDEFLANTSHELRTPLNGIISLVDGLLKGIGGPLAPNQRKNLKLVLVSARRLSSLVNDILDFSRIKNRDIRLNLKNTDISSILAMVVELFRHQIDHKEIRLVNQVPREMDMIWADENRLSQILFNLIGNAVKYTEKGTITIGAEIVGGKMRLSVEDTGIGIPEDRLGQVFEAFEQSGYSPEKEGGGTGLGLSITRQLVELHGGSITVTSVLGKGTTFTFTMPLASGDNRLPCRNDGKNTGETELFPQQATSHETHSFYVQPVTEIHLPAVEKSEFTIMLVDDEPVNIQSLANVLSLRGYRTIHAQTGQQALEMLATGNEPDLCIVDVMMPRMNGFEVCREIRKQFNSFQMPVIFLTARYGEQDLTLGFDAGGNDFLHKPFEETELIARVATLLQLKKSVAAAMAAEVAFLQAQIKPHFLYNALNTIAAHCENGSQEAGNLILSLARYLRGSLCFENLHETVTLEKELALTEAYVTIEKARFPDIQVCFQIEAPPDCLLPPVTLQPLVENAIRHGIRQKEGGGTVVLRVMQQGERLAVEVVDDGKGMAAHQIAQVLSMNGETGSVGLRNIHTRLQRLYGAGLTIESQPLEGSKVGFVLPCRQEGSYAQASTRKETFHVPF